MASFSSSYANLNHKLNCVTRLGYRSMLDESLSKSAFFYSQFWNENGWYRMHSQHSGHSHSRIVNKRNRALNHFVD